MSWIDSKNLFTDRTLESMESQAQGLVAANLGALEEHTHNI